MDREEVQSRRAYNQIWNGAGRYDIRPEQAAFDAYGDADLYMNTVMGLAYGQYDFARFQPMLHSFQQQIKGGLYTDVFWLGLEHAVFTRAEKDRPALPVLRRAYAQRILSQPHPQDPRESAQGLQAAWARRLITEKAPEDPWLSGLLTASGRPLLGVISAARAAASVSSGPTPSGLWAEPTPVKAPAEGERESPCAF